MLALSGRTETALKELADKYLQVFHQNPDLDWSDVCRTAGIGRSHFEYRLAIIAADLHEAKERIATFQQNVKHSRIQSGRAPKSTPPGVVFMFTGQGSQYPGMGRDLYETQPVFRRELEKCAEILRPLLDKPLLEVFFAPEGELKEGHRASHLLHETQYTQPALFALEYALAMMWRSWGIEPTAVLGHSVGEYVAACFAGVFSVEDGLRLIAERGRLMAALPGGGTMAAVFAEESRVTAAIGAEGSKAAIACVNGPADMVISGQDAAVEAILNRLRMAGIRSQPLSVSHAFHSSLMDPVLDSFQSFAAKVHYAEPFVAIVSNVTGKMATPGLMTSAEYWRKHIRNPVRFADSIRALRETGRSIFLEIGPHPVLEGMARKTAPEPEVVWASSLKRGQGSRENLLNSASSFYVQGIDLEWSGVQAPRLGKRISLPTYPFQRSRYWLEEKAADSPSETNHSYLGNGQSHPFFGNRLDSPAIAGAVFEVKTEVEHSPFSNDHRIFGRLMMPAAACLEMALAGAAEVSNLAEAESMPCQVTNFSIREPIFLSEEDPCFIQLILSQPTEHGMTFKVCQRETTEGTGRRWRTSATGRIWLGIATPRSEPSTWKRVEVWNRCSEEIDPHVFYDLLSHLGFTFGKRFRGIGRLRRRDGEALAEIQLPGCLENDAGSYRIHPALLDSCFQTLGAALPQERGKNAYFIVALERFTLFKVPSGKLWSHAFLHSVPNSDPEAFGGELRLYDDDGTIVAEIVGLHLEPVTLDPATGLPGSQRKNWFYEVKWRQEEASVNTLGDQQFDLTADFIPSPSLLAEEAKNELGTLAKSEKLSTYEESTPKLESLSAAFVRRAFFQMGWSPQIGERFTAQEIAAQLGVIPGYQRLFKRLISIFVEDGVLKQEGDGWIVSKQPEEPSLDLRSEAEGLKQQFPVCTAEITLTARCAERLDEVLTGNCNPLDLLFPGGNFDTADALYRSSPLARALNTAVRHVLVRAMRDAPKERAVRILEIGAGTGGTTSFLLPHLRTEGTRYTFTDISPLFLARAREEFRGYSFANFQLLDIEKSPNAQGWGERAFDVIVAANVLHAARDLREALANAVALLAPGGVLILLEGTHRQLWADLTFGLTEGWWRFDDVALRSDYPLLPAEKWKTLFEEAGLEIFYVTAPLGIGAAVIQQAILIGRKPLISDPIKPAENSTDFWIVLRDTKGIAEEVAKLISEQKEECVLISQDSALHFAAEDGQMALNPDRAADFRRLFREILENRQSRLKGILNLWPIDEESDEETTPAQWEAAQSRLGGGVLHATQAFLTLEPNRIARGARMWLATRGAQADLLDNDGDGGSCQPVQALVWGLARQISIEHPEHFGAVVDIDFKEPSEDSATTIWREMGNLGEPGVAYRGGRRLLPRLIRAAQPPSDFLTLRSNGSYLITGGLGKCVLETAHWMAERGAGHIVLLGQDFPERLFWDQLSPQDNFRDIALSILSAEKLGARITIVPGDLTDERGMASIFQRFGTKDPPLCGIVHTALEVRPDSMLELNLEKFQKVCCAKTLGAWILHRLTADIKLDFFILFSSTIALWGATGLGHIAAADQTLEQLARWRRRHGLPALSINWGNWQASHLMTGKENDETAKLAFLPMPNTQALAALEDLIPTDRVSSAVAAVDWSALYASGRPDRTQSLFAEIQSSPATENEIIDFRKSDALDSEIAFHLENAPPTRRRELLISHLRSEASRILGFDLSRELDLEQGLFDMGMDSLMAMEFKGRLQQSLSVPLPSTLTFNHPTIKALADYLLSEVLGLSTVPQQENTVQMLTPDYAADPPQRSSDDLSEDELSVLLLRKLEELQ